MVLFRDPSWRQGRRLQPVHEMQDLGEQSSGDSDFRELESDVATMTHDLGADLERDSPDDSSRLLTMVAQTDGAGPDRVRYIAIARIGLIWQSKTLPCGHFAHRGRTPGPRSLRKPLETISALPLLTFIQLRERSLHSWSFLYRDVDTGYFESVFCVRCFSWTPFFEQPQKSGSKVVFSKLWFPSLRRSI